MPPSSDAASPTLAPALSARFRFWSLVAMLLLVYVHAFNLHPRYLAPMTLVEDTATWDHVLQFYIANSLVRFRIPMLFAISGYLFAWRDDGRTPHRIRLLSRLRSLGIPYLAWSAIALAFTAALELWSPTRELVRAAALSSYGPEHPFVTGYSASQVLNRWLFDPLAFQLWFLRTLLIVTALYPWLRLAVTRWPRVFFTVATLLWVLLDVEGLPFFSLGIWLAATNANILTPPRWFHTRIALAIWLVLGGIKTWMAFHIESMNAPTALVMLVLHRSGELTGLLTAWFGLHAVAEAAMQQRWFRWCAGFAFIIYALHVPMVNYATEAALAAGAGIAHIELLTYLLVPVAVIMLCMATGAALRAVARPVYAVLTGGRGL